MKYKSEKLIKPDCNGLFFIQNWPFLQKYHFLQPVSMVTVLLKVSQTKQTIGKENLGLAEQFDAPKVYIAMQNPFKINLQFTTCAARQQSTELVNFMTCSARQLSSEEVKEWKH